VVELDRFLTFLAAAAVLAAIPGPGMLYVAARTLGGGRRAGLLSTAGTAVGGLAHVLAAAAGLSALLATSSVAFTVVKYAGAAYLVYLGVRTLLRRDADRELLAERPASGKGAFRQGVLTEALNPKTALFFLAFVPQFLTTEAGSVWWQAVLLGLISVTLNTLADVVAVVLTSTVRSRLPRRGDRPVRWPRFASGGALIALGGYAAAES
jgi:threonine/homoserine/homoserine lactone efflux protein